MAYYKSPKIYEEFNKLSSPGTLIPKDRRSPGPLNKKVEGAGLYGSTNIWSVTKTIELQLAATSHNVINAC